MNKADWFRDGIVRLDPMPPDCLAEYLAFLEGKPTYPGHVKATPADGIECYAMETVVRAPHFFDMGIWFTPLVSEYFNSPAYMWSLNAFRTFPGGEIAVTQKWHFDGEDSKMMALFMFCTDVETVEDGAHFFKKGTQHGGTEGEVEVITGNAGTAFLADPRGLHYGVKPRTKPRLISWIRWAGSKPPGPYIGENLYPIALGDRVPDDPILRDAVSLVAHP